jgi:hypothetical protein
LQKLAVVWAKNANIFAKFFGENILKIITSVPDWPNFRLLGECLHMYVGLSVHLKMTELAKYVFFPLQKRWIR